MKKIGRILSLVLAVCLISACFTVNVMAASKAHAVTITTSKSTDLAAGDTITVEIKIDNTEKLVACEYDLYYDKTAFSIDTEKVNRVEKCIDKAWLDGMKDTDGDWGYYLSSFAYNVNLDSHFHFGWAGAYGVEAEYAVDNRVIGKFYFTVNEDVAAGDYEFSLTGLTGDSGQNSTADMTCSAVKVTVGSGTSTPVDPSTDNITVTPGSTSGVDIVAGDREGKKYDNAYAVTASISNSDTNAAAITAAGVLFIPETVLGSETLTLSTASAAKAEAPAAVLGNGTLTLKAAIKDIPAALAGRDIKMVTRAYGVTSGDPIYGAQNTTTINFTKTAE